MADGDKIVTLPPDDKTIARTQDQRGGTGRGTDAKKLETDVEKALETAGGIDKTGQDDGEDAVEITPEEAKALRAQVRREKQRADAAEARAEAGEETTAQALDGKAQADLNVLKGAKTQLETSQASLKEKLAAAHADGDFNAVADITADMTKVSTQLTNVEGGIIALENYPKQQEALRRRGEPAEQKFHQITKGMHPVAKQWFKDNPDYWQDDTKLKRVIRAHENVMDSDDPPEPNTPEYLEAVEAELGKRDPNFVAGGRSRTSGGGRGNGGGGEGGEFEDEEALSEAAEGDRRNGARPPAAAAPSRRGQLSGGGGSGPGGGRQVRLSKEQQEAADISGVSHEEYAANLTNLKKEDRIGAGAQNKNRMH